MSIKIQPDGRPAFHGDIYFRSVPRLPEGAREVATPDARPGEHVVAHSETGHHHVALGGRYFAHPTDPMLAYLVTTAPVTQVEHRRAWDTHETFELLNDMEALRGDVGEVVWEIGRQREDAGPEGWRRVED